MKKALFFYLQVSLYTIGYFFASSSITQAQVTTDDTVNTQVNQNGNVSEITGGETRGSNLFHSFQDFSVSTGNEASFLNADNISNIFSRVTGGNISNIDGTLRANGSASLFLINPAGIVFGNNARLDIGGSFYGSSASSILFENGEFSATDLDNPPLLTINAPIGLGFRDEPGDIVNRSFAQNSTGEFVGLEISSGNNLAFVGGNINFETGRATARGGNIYLGGLAEAGTVGLNEDGSLSFPPDLTLANITLTNAAELNVQSTGFGNIAIDARNLTLEAGEFGGSAILGGIAANSTSTDAQAGNITINVAENINSNESRILNPVATEGVGNSGNITINTDSLELTNGSVIGTSTFGNGNAGAVSVTATGDITADGGSPFGFPSGITSGVNPGAFGDAGGVTLSTTNLNLTAGGVIDANTFGTGDAGLVDITATGDITVDGETEAGSNSGITSLVGPDAFGNAGGVTLRANNLNLSEGGRIAADTLGNGNAGEVSVTATGDITADGSDSEGFLSGITSGVNPGAFGNAGGVTLRTTNLNLSEGGVIAADTLGNGNAGAVSVTATGDITADGSDSFGFPSGITSGVNSDAEGNSGGVTISTNNLNLSEGGRIDANTFGTGNAGLVDITATGDITVDGETEAGSNSNITSLVNPGAEGDAGGVTLRANNLNLSEGGLIAADTFGTGNAGEVSVTATGDTTIDGSDSFGFPSGITSLVNPGAEGDAGGVTLRATNLNLTNGGRIGASTLGNGNAGAVSVTSTGDTTIDGSDSFGFPSGIASVVAPDAFGNAGGVTLRATNLNLSEGGQVNASTFGNGDANNVTINASESISIDGAVDRFRSGISANALNENGSGGDVFITTGSLTIANGGTVEATNFDNIGNNGNPGTGRPGSINITANSIELTDSARIEAATQFAEGESGNIDLNVAEDIILDNNSFISAQAFNNADGGNLTIDTQFIIAFADSGTGNDLVAAAEQGIGGNIELNVDQIFGLQPREAIDANSNFLLNNTNDIDVSGSIDGNLSINASNIDPLRGTTELPTNIVEPEETSQQACRANRETGVKNGLNITGKGGVVPDPVSPLSSLNVTANGETNPISAIPAPIETSRGKIQPARGIKVNESGEITLTAYRTNNAGDRLTEIKPNCGGV